VIAPAKVTCLSVLPPHTTNSFLKKDAVAADLESIQ
jgi:hypothetical protein